MSAWAGEFLSALLRRRPDLLADLARRDRVALPRKLRAGPGLGPRAPTLWTGGRQWIAVDVQLRPEPDKRTGWPLDYLRLWRRLGRPGRFLVLTRSTTVVEWCRGAAFKYDTLAFRPAVINLRGYADELLDSPDEDRALLGFWACAERGSAATVGRALRAVAAAARKDPARGWEAANVVTRLCTRKVREMLVRRFLQPEQFQTEEMRNMVRYLQGLTERQARHSERVRTMQELLCRLLARHRVRLSRLDRDLVRRVVQQRALSRLIDEAAACSGAKEAEALLSRVRKLAAALPLRSGRRRKQGR